MFKRQELKIFICTIVSIILSWYISVLLHEYGHATTAWFLGYKNSPLDIYIANWYLLPISEAVDYASILSKGHGFHEALIGISGFIVTTILYFISILFLQNKYVQNNTFYVSFFFWLTAINLMEIFSYVPNRIFIAGDISEFVQGLNISPLWIFIPGTITVCLALYCFYKYEVPKMFYLLPIKSLIMRRIFLWLTFWPLTLTIVYWEPPAQWILLSNLSNIASICLVLFIIYYFDPKNNR